MESDSKDTINEKMIPPQANTLSRGGKTNLSIRAAKRKTWQSI